MKQLQNSANTLKPSKKLFKARVNKCSIASFIEYLIFKSSNDRSKSVKNETT